MAHCSIVGCKNKQANNSKVTYFISQLPKDLQRRKNWLAAISWDKSNLPSNVFVCSDHFEGKYFDKSWDLQNRIFFTDRPIKRKLISTAIPTLLPRHISKYQHLENLLRLEQSRKKKKKRQYFGTGFGYHKSNGFLKKVLI